MRWYQRRVHGEISSASRHSGRGSVTFPAMSYKLCLGLFLILAVIVLGSADDQSQDLGLSDKLNRVAREAETTNGKKKNDKKTNKIKRKRNRTKRRKANKGKAKKKNANKGQAKKKRGQKKKGKNNPKKKRKGKNRPSKRNKNGKIRGKGKKRGDKKKIKGKNADKKKRNKNGRGRGNRRNNKKNRKRNRSTSTVSAKCYSQTVFIMKIWKDVVSNFKKQNARMKAQNKTGNSKSGKKGLFAPTAFKLIDIGGGNRSNLSCGGTYGSDGAKQLGNLTKTLFDCEVNVNASCNVANFPQPNTTFIEACETGTTSFETQGKACLKKVSNVTAACECFTSSSFNASAEAVKGCDASTFSSAIKKQLNKCKVAFSKCRKYEDDAVDALSACTKTQAQHTQKAAQLKANSDALTAAKTKMASLASGATSSRHRGARQTATSCSAVISKATTLISIVANFPEATIVVSLSAEISSVSGVTCTTAEKAQMSTAVTSITVVITTVNQALVVVQKLLLQTTGTTQADKDLTTSTAATTASGSGSSDSTTTGGSDTTTGGSDTTTAGGSDSTTAGGSDSTTAAGSTDGSSASTSGESSSPAMTTSATRRR